jgi:NLR family CARD domain-containing protein 3
VNLDGFALPVKELKGTDPVETLDLSRKSLCVASAVVIASLIGANGALTSIDLSSNQLTNYSKDMMGINELAAALGANGALTNLKYVRPNVWAKL